MEHGYFKWQFIPLIKKRRMQVLWQAVNRTRGALWQIRAESATQGAQAQLVALPLLGSFSLAFRSQLSRKHYPHRRPMQQLWPQAAVGGERCFIQMLQPCLFQLVREGIVPMGCFTLAAGPFTPEGFLIKFPGQSSKKTRNLCQLDGAAVITLLGAPWG